VVYFSKRPNISRGGRLNFIKFETEKIDECIDFIGNLVAARHSDSSDLNPIHPKEKIVIKATGGGSHKFYDSFTKKLNGVEVEKADEMECLITGKKILVSQYVQICKVLNSCYINYFRIKFLDR
jgi:pantothenate kinase